MAVLCGCWACLFHLPRPPPPSGPGEHSGQAPGAGPGQLEDAYSHTVAVQFTTFPVTLEWGW